MALPAPGSRYSMHKFDANGVDDTFQINFADGYLSKDYVYARAYDKDTEFNSVPLTITFVSESANSATVRVSPVQATGRIVEIFRYTPRDVPLVDFRDRSMLTAENLNTVTRQTVHAVAEVEDQYNETRDAVEEQASRIEEIYQDIQGVYDQAKADLIASYYLVPVPFVEGMTVSRPNMTVTYGGVVYAPDPNAVPFVAGAAPDAQWRVLQGVTYADLNGTGGAASVGLPVAGRVSDAIKYVTPFMHGAVGGGVVDDTAAIRLAILDAETRNLPLDLRGAEWRISGTLDFTRLFTVRSDRTSIIRVNPVGFTATTTKRFAVLFGNPDLPRTEGRHVYGNLEGLLMVVSDSRAAPLHGVYIKGNLLKMDQLRVNNFNGIGVERDSVYDSLFGSISIELCGNVTDYAYFEHSNGDTSNTNFTSRLQVERAYHRAFSITCIRSVYNTIHAERCAVLSTNDGTTGLSGGLTYRNALLNVGNSTINQMVFHVLDTGTAPDGTALAATKGSMSTGLDYSSLRDANVANIQISTTAGRSGNYGQVLASDWHWGGGASVVFGNSIENAAVTGTFRPGAKLSVNGGTYNIVNPASNCSDLIMRDADIENLTFGSVLLGDITFDNCRFPPTMTLGTTQAPAGFNGTTFQLNETRRPVTFRSCTFLGRVAGFFNARAYFDACQFANFDVVSQTFFDLQNCTGTVFNYTGNVGTTTRNCRFATVTKWAVPTSGRYAIGTITERLGAGTGTGFVSNTQTTVGFTQLY